MSRRSLERAWQYLEETQTCIRQTSDVPEDPARPLAAAIQCLIVHLAELEEKSHKPNRRKR